MPTLRYRIWSAIRRRPASALELADEMQMDRRRVQDNMRRLREAGQITLDHKEGREVFYRATGVPCAEDYRDGRPGPRGPRGQARPYRKRVEPKRVGGGCALAECWRGAR